MSLKYVFFSVGCLLAWFVLLPLLVIVGGIALLVYAVIAELGAVLAGNPGTALDTSAAREIARRVCGDYGARARNTRRHPLR